MTIPIDISHKTMTNMAEKAKEARREKYLEGSRKRLETIIRKKMRTTFIGALDSFEKNFGDLWGHGLHDDELSEEQLEFKAIWDATRTDVLNKGNTQLRALQTELANHVVSWNRYVLELPVSENYNE